MRPSVTPRNERASHRHLVIELNATNNGNAPVESASGSSSGNGLNERSTSAGSNRRVRSTALMRIADPGPAGDPGGSNIRV